MSKRFPVGLFGLSLIAIIAVSAIAVSFGAEITLFPEPLEEVCLFTPDELCSVSLFPNAKTEQAVSLSTKGVPFALFDVSGDHRFFEQDDPAIGGGAEIALFEGDFSRNQSDQEKDVKDTSGEKDSKYTAGSTKADASAERPFVNYYAPRWCRACGTELLGGDDVPARFMAKGDVWKWTGGDTRVKVCIVKGDESQFPPEILDYAAKHGGWPVQHWASPKGKGAFENGRKSIDELAELVKTEPGDWARRPELTRQRIVTVKR